MIDPSDAETRLAPQTGASNASISPPRPASTFILPSIEGLGKRVGTGGSNLIHELTTPEGIRAVKFPILSGDPTEDDRVKEMLRHESEMYEAIGYHHRFLKHHGFGLAPNGVPYLILDLVTPSRTLAEYARESNNLPTISFNECGSMRSLWKLFAQIGGSVQFLHNQGILHCDISATSILVDLPIGKQSPNAFLSDFGIARQVYGDAEALPEVVRYAVGTSPYLAPELIYGSGTNRRLYPFTTMSDMYALGVVLYQIVTGRLPRTDGLGSTTRTSVLSPRDVRPDVPDSLSTVCMKAISDAPTQRYGSPRLLRDALRAALPQWDKMLKENWVVTSSKR